MSSEHHQGLHPVKEEVTTGEHRTTVQSTVYEVRGTVTPTLVNFGVWTTECLIR